MSRTLMLGLDDVGMARTIAATSDDALRVFESSPAAFLDAFNALRAAPIWTVARLTASGVVAAGLTAGGTRVVWKGTNYGINAAPGHASNSEDDPQVTADGVPKAGSPLLGAGVFTDFARDFGRRQFRVPPSIGAYEPSRARTQR